MPVAVARALGLPDQLGSSATDPLVRFIADRQTLLVLDNCEHLLDATASLAVALLGARPALRLLATSRHVYTKLGLSSRVQLAREAARRT